MRCNNCGWDNQSGSSSCIKCNTPLEKSNSEIKKTSSADDQFGKTINDNDGLQMPQNNYLFEKTSVEQNTDSLSDNSEIEQDILISCSNSECGYLNPSDALVCSKCKAPIQTLENNQLSEKELKPLPTVYPNISNINSSYMGTIDPYKINNTIPNCSLSLVLREGEKDLISSVEVERKFKFDKSAIQLNRGNLDEGNNTITSKTQAELFFENGKWYLLNKSEMQTTFVLAKERIEIKEGDVVLMGNRKFIFSTTIKAI